MPIEDDDQPGAALPATLPSAQNPLVTAPMTVERPPDAAAGFPGLAVAANDALRKLGPVRGLRLFHQANQATGFDCPGCAWPTPDHPRRLELCESGARAVADEGGQRRATANFFATYTLRELGQRSDQWLAGQGRLTEPMIHLPGTPGYVPISWEDAIARVAEALRGLERPSQAAFYASGRSSNEAAFLLGLLARRLGTNNLAHCANLCHDASRIALREQLGVERATVGLADFERCEAVLCFGHNPGSNHPRMLDSLRMAKARGAKLIAINPLLETGLRRVKDLRRRSDWFGPGEALCDLYLQIRPGTDAFVIAALIKGTIEAGAVAREFVDAHTTGYEALATKIEDLSWAQLSAGCGCPEEDLRAAAAVFAGSRATIASWGTGLTQHEHGVDTLRALLGALLLRGSVGRPGAGALPLMGHSNVVGSTRVGVDHRPSATLLDALEAGLGFAPPREPGHDVGGALAAMLAGEVRVLFGLGGNLLSAAPDTERAAEALRRCALTVHVSTKLNRGHLITGETALILPCLSRSELERQQGGPALLSFEGLDGRTKLGRGHATPASPQLRGEPRILAELGAACFPDDPHVDWPALASDYGQIRTLIERCVGDPAPLPETLPLAPARLQLALPEAPTLDDDQLLLTTLRSHDQHNSVIYAPGDRLRGIEGYRRLIMINLGDLEQLGLEPYDQVDLISEHDGRRRVAERWVAVPHHVPPGCCAAYFPEANVLVPLERRDPHSGTPASKSVVIRVRKSAPLPERKMPRRRRID
ncbi:molybdopterin-dependent oxidoreductase [Pseudenhygromyxa sp. WMMC2535]|uniref:molybdopterin-dependent oxidoreductase n=1 Tax=Pseudenhygromyxa sp. WMMC2535 TaxID=2712867 RepID=UPI001557CA5F|nr:molybdopterin-dependent oxidoreductase [Pseudenhygromyxa sp. WMMC2535]NVB42611.1 molybdopterin-dependent oxidoreductase [Pseudenhygromyxa sp. WMMC2535]